MSNPKNLPEYSLKDICKIYRLFSKILILTLPPCPQESESDKFYTFIRAESPHLYLF